MSKSQRRCFFWFKATRVKKISTSANVHIKTPYLTRRGIFLASSFFLLLSCTPAVTKNTSEPVSPLKDSSTNTSEPVNPQKDSPQRVTISPTDSSQKPSSHENILGIEMGHVIRNPSLNPLISFYHALKRLGFEKENQVNILHLGDSHTAGDKFSGRLRRLFQRQFKSAGRGMLPAGKPFSYFRPTHVSISQTKGWKLNSSYRSRKNGPYGLSGFRTLGTSPNQSISLKMTDDTTFDEVEVEFFSHPNSGTMLVRINDWNIQEITTTGMDREIFRETLSAAGVGHQIKIYPKGDGPIELLSWTFKRKKPGVLYHSHGIVGATVNVISHWDPKVVEWELQHLNPSLIIIAYGTNEGFNDALNKEMYRKNFRDRLRLLHNAAPLASVVIVGPPDANRLPRFCQKRREVECSSLTADEIENYAELLKQKNKQLCRWHPPPMLNVVREIQKEVAIEQGYFFWDWAEVMDGACGIDTWNRKKLPLAGKDHVHLTNRGYQTSAEALFKKIMAQYQ
jgi:lysophospholipase L1-like esterase